MSESTSAILKGLHSINYLEARHVLADHFGGSCQTDSDTLYQLVVLQPLSDIPDSLFTLDYDGVYIMQDHRALYVLFYKSPAKVVQLSLL